MEGRTIEVTNTIAAHGQQQGNRGEVPRDCLSSQQSEVRQSLLAALHPYCSQISNRGLGSVFRILSRPNDHKGKCHYCIAGAASVGRSSYASLGRRDNTHSAQVLELE